MKKRNRAWIWILVVVLLIGGGAGGWYWYSQQNQEPVFVFGFDQGIPGMADYQDYSGESSGMVTTDRVQNVFLSGTQTITEMLVTEGQQVKKGDVLFTYDTTLSDIALMQKDLAVQQAKLNLQTAEKELRVINSYKPIRYYEVEVPEPTEPAEPVADLKQFDLTDKTYLAYSGSGSTSLTPKYCWLKSGTMIDEAMMRSLFEGAEGDVLFVRFQHTKGDTADGEITKEHGVKLMKLTTTDEAGNSRATFRFSFYDIVIPEAPPVDPGVEWNSGFTSSEISAMKKAKKEEIKNLEFQIKMEEAEYRIMQKEADSGEVLAEFDGTVVGVLDPESAEMMGMPILKVSGGGGFFIQGSISELEKDKLLPGQEVTINDWNTGMTYTGEIRTVGDFPTLSDGWNGIGNPNSSYYPFTAFVDETADLQAGSYCSIQFSTAGAEQGVYLENAFIRQEQGRHYVYLRGESGKLEKRYVAVGKSLWGSYKQILSGITEDDLLAFPYGKNLKEGSDTVESDLSVLYE